MPENPSKIKILIVDDSELVTSVMKKFFRDYDFEVFISNDGLGGIKIAVEEKPSIIFLDLSMPRMTGYDMMKVLKSLEETKFIPIIVITAHDDNKSISTALREGAAKVIVKPITKKAIIIEMEQIFGYSIFSSIQAQRISAEEKRWNSDEKILADEEKPNSLKTLVKMVDPTVKDINNFLEVKNEVQLRSIMFELAAYSKRLSISRLGSLCDYLLQHMTKPVNELNWEEIKRNTDNIISFLKQLKASNNNSY